MKVSDIKTPVSSIAGIGPQLTKTLAKVNVFTVGDLLQYFPRDYEDRTQKVTFREQAQHYGKVHTVAQVTGHEWFGYGKMKTLKIIVNDGTGSAELICFNRAFLEKSLIPGTLITVTGKFEVKYNKLQSTAFEAVKMEVPEELQNHIKEYRFDAIQPVDCGVIPIYPLTEGLTQKAVSKAIANALQQYAHGIEDELPEELIQQRGLMKKQDALRLVHQPQSIAQAQEARNTLAYEELYHFQYIIAERTYKRKGLTSQTNARENVSEAEFANTLSPLQIDFLNSLPFHLQKTSEKLSLKWMKKLTAVIRNANVF